MSDKELKYSIQAAIKAFSSGNCYDNSKKLFDVLGYNTQRKNPFPQKTFACFKDTFLDGNDTFNDSKALVGKWQSVDLLFQLTTSEVSNQGQIFDTKKVDNTIIETYLFFAIELQIGDYTRTQLAQITREINKIFPMPVLLVFKNGDLITISVINRRLNKKNEGKDVLEKVTLIKDISIESPHRAHIEILHDLSFAQLQEVHGFSNFVELHNAWQKTLDTKELNKRFYRDLSHWYFWALHEVTFPTTDLSADKNNLLKDEDKVKEHTAKNLIRLLTRILFAWFVKEKNLIPDELFDEEYIRENLLNGFEPRKKKGFDHKSQGSKYYRAILQNLFFATLNQPVGKREFRKDGQHVNVTNLMRYENYFKNPKSFIKLVEDVVPFMNGGLFECLDGPDTVLKGKNGGDVIVYEDCFSDRKDNLLCVPDYIFFGTEHADLSEELGDKKQNDVTVSGLINILKSYKFTVTENTPIEEDIALDPELLGRVFENLLASYNPETKTTARNQTGSFYTPREIVNYMVDESLKAYLKQKLVDESIMKADDAEVGLELLVGYNEKEHLFDDEQTSVLINAIDECKILDPACGSGAFPMGILHKLVHVLHKLDPQNKLWKEKQIEKAQLIDDVEIREKLIEDIETAFDSNELDYGRKLYLIENCIYGVDIQPIATQISKLRFFISLIVDQKSNKSQHNFGIRPLPNLETKFVAADTLVIVEKPSAQTSLFDNKHLKELEVQLKSVRHRLFSAKTPNTKRKLREEDQQLREKMSTILEKDGWSNENAQKISSWDPYNQNKSCDWFDSEWMFGIGSGFNIVIGNPPYGILNKKQNKAESILVTEERLDYFKTSEYYQPATGGMLNIFRLFILRSIRLLVDGGVFSEIFPLAFTGDLSIKKLRRYILDNYQILSIEAFPERDNPNKRVFEAVKMSVCILNLKKSNTAHPFFMRINNDRFVQEDSAEKTWFSRREIELLDSVNLTFPLTSKQETKLLLSIFSKGKRFREIGECCTGEIDMTFCKNCFTDNESDAVLIKGAIIDRYLLRKKMSQGEIVFINEKKLAKIKHVDESLKLQERIVLQGITGVNEKTRLKMMIVDNVYCANSLNYLKVPAHLDKKMLLAIFNSKLMNFVFSKFSTNSNVNGYEIDGLPICFSDEYEKPLITLVDIVMHIKKQNGNSEFFEHLVDAIVYEMYFPEILQQNHSEISPLLSILNTFRAARSIADKMKSIDAIQKEALSPKHPISIAMNNQRKIQEIRLIEGLD